MDPVSLSVSILLPAVRWLVNATIGRKIGEAWQQYVKSVDLHKEDDNLKAELNKIKLLVEAADSATLQGQKVKLMNDYLKEVKELVYEARDLIDELDYFRLQQEVKEMNKPKHVGCVFKERSFRQLTSSVSTIGSQKEFDGLYQA